MPLNMLFSLPGMTPPSSQSGKFLDILHHWIQTSLIPAKLSLHTLQAQKVVLPACCLSKVYRSPLL